MKAVIRFGSILPLMTPRVATPDANTLATREQIARKPRPNLEMMGKGRGGITASHPIKTAAANALTVTRTIIALCVGDNLRRLQMRFAHSGSLARSSAIKQSV